MENYEDDEKKEIFTRVLMYLDGWSVVESIEEKNSKDDDETEEIFNNTELTDEELIKLFDKSNKEITKTLLLLHYESSLKQSFSYTKQRKDTISKLNKEDKELFYQAVYKLTASNLWKIFNPRVNSNESEDTWKDSYGGVLYIQASKELKPFLIEFNAAVLYIVDE